MDRLTFVWALEKGAALMRELGLHRVTRLGRHISKSLLGDLSVEFDGLHMVGSIEHRGHLHYARSGQIEPFMSHTFQSVVKPGMVVLDIGAHLGYYTLLAAKAGAKVYSFEPDPRTFPYLVRNIHTNGFGDRVVSVPKAVSDRTERVTLFLDNNDTPGQSSLFHRTGKVNGMIVDCIRLDEFLDETVVVDLVKIDIEGAELHALKGMERIVEQASERLTMFVECNAPCLRSAGNSVNLLVDWLRAHGFGIVFIEEQNRLLSSTNVPILESMGSVNLYCSRSK